MNHPRVRSVICRLVGGPARVHKARAAAESESTRSAVGEKQDAALHLEMHDNGAGRRGDMERISHWLAIALVASVTSVTGQSTHRTPDGPPVPFEDPGACPFEGCVYREWTAKS